MSFTHVEIEERKSRNLAFLFAAVVFLYAFSMAACVLAWHVFVGSEIKEAASASPALFSLGRHTLVILVLSLTVGLIHWLWSIDRMFDRTLEALGVRALDEQDPYHQRLANIVSEVSVATGGRSIQVYAIPTPAVNACSVSDFGGRAAIAVTEGALALFSRQQLESVIGHEAAHIVSGDSLTSSVFCALFALHEEALKRLGGVFDGHNIRIRGRAGAFLLVIYVILAIAKGGKTLCAMLISHEKEYRADAVAVRLTRNPLSLAEALRVIVRRWHGVGMRGESLSTLFIVDPGTEHFSEQEGLLADLFTTHPPTERRIGLLLSMAGVDPAAFEAAAAAARPPARQPAPSGAPAALKAPSDTWLVYDGTEWQGPWTLSEVEGSGQLKPDTWVRHPDDSQVKPAYLDAQLLQAIRARFGAASGAPAGRECPKCRVGLSPALYEGTAIERCPSCEGCYVKADDMVKILTREEYEIPEPVKRFGDALLTERGYREARNQLKARLPRQAKHWACPACKAAFVRKFYTEAYPVEVEQCWECGLAWLDKMELELLQYIYEKRKALGAFDEPPGSDEIPPAT